MEKQDKIIAGAAIGTIVLGAGLAVSGIVRHFRFRYWEKRLIHAEALENKFQQARWELMDDIREES